MSEHYFDTYALIEIIYANPNYNKFSGSIAFCTTRLNLMELYYGLLRKYDKKTAELYYDRFLPFCHEITDEIIKEAVEFRFLRKQQKLSYVDCIGYIMAKQRGIPFLTGDKEFEHLPGVEFVK